MPILSAILKVFPQIKKALQTNKAFKILDSDDRLHGSDWTVGGCWFLANALKILFPKAQLVQIYNPISKKTEHVGIFLDGLIWDADGKFTFGTWINHFIDENILLKKEFYMKLKASVARTNLKYFREV